MEYITSRCIYNYYFESQIDIPGKTAARQGGRAFARGNVEGEEPASSTKGQRLLNCCKTVETEENKSG